MWLGVCTHWDLCPAEPQQLVPRWPCALDWRLWRLSAVRKVGIVLGVFIFALIVGTDKYLKGLKGAGWSS